MAALHVVRVTIPEAQAASDTFNLADMHLRAIIGAGDVNQDGGLAWLHIEAAARYGDRFADVSRHRPYDYIDCHDARAAGFIARLVIRHDTGRPIIQSSERHLDLILEPR